MAQKMTKQDKYEVNQRNGFYMWAYNASINTVNNIQRVKEGQIWVPMYDEVRLKPCPKPPLKSFVQRAVENALQEKEEWRLHQKSELEQGNIQPNEELLKAIKRPYVLDMTSSHSPDIEWLLVVLSTLQPNHRYFGKSYFPSDEELGGRGTKVKPPKDDEYDEFFDNLPDHLSKAKYSRKAPANENLSQSGNDSQMHSASNTQRNKDREEIEKLKKQVQELQGQQNGFVPFNQNQRNIQMQNGYPNQNGFNFQNQQNFQFRQNQFAGFNRNVQQQINSNDATFGQHHFNSVYEEQNQFNSGGNQQQQNLSKKEMAINTVLNNAIKTKKIYPEILSLTNQGNDPQFDTNGNEEQKQVSQNKNLFQFPTVSSQIYQTGSKLNKQIFVKEKSPRQTTIGITDQTTGVYENQSNSVHVTPTKFKMSKVHILFQDTTEGGNYKQVSQSEVKENQAPNIKDNYMVNNIIVQSSNGESTNPVDLKSLNRMLTNYPQHLQQQLKENHNF